MFAITVCHYFRQLHITPPNTHTSLLPATRLKQFISVAGLRLGRRAARAPLRLHAAPSRRELVVGRPPRPAREVAHVTASAPRGLAAAGIPCFFPQCRLRRPQFVTTSPAGPDSARRTWTLRARTPPCGGGGGPGELALRAGRREFVPIR